MRCGHTGVSGEGRSSAVSDGSVSSAAAKRLADRGKRRWRPLGGPPAAEQTPRPPALGPRPARATVVRAASSAPLDAAAVAERERDAFFLQRRR